MLCTLEYCTVAKTRPLPSDLVLFTSAGTCTCNPNAPCSFYEKTEHCQCKCFTLQCVRKNYKSLKHKEKKSIQANSASTTTASGPSSPSFTAASAAANFVFTASQNALWNCPQQNGVAEHANRVLAEGSPPCWMSLALPWPSGVRHSLLLSMSGTGALPLQWMMPHPMSYYGMITSQIFLISGYGDVLSIYADRGTSAMHWLFIMRSVSLLAIHKDTKVGSFTTLPPSALLSLSALTLMSAISWLARNIPSSFELVSSVSSFRKLLLAWVWKMPGPANCALHMSFILKSIEKSQTIGILYCFIMTSNRCLSNGISEVP